MTTADDGVTKEGRVQKSPPFEIADDDDATAPLTKPLRLTGDEPADRRQPDAADGDAPIRSETASAESAPISAEKALPPPGPITKTEAKTGQPASKAKNEPASEPADAVSNVDAVPEVEVAEAAVKPVNELSPDKAEPEAETKETETEAETAKETAESVTAEPERPIPATTPKRVPVPVGDVLRDRYEILEVIGLGGMSTVYRALDRFRARARSPYAQVALKVVNVSTELGSDAVELMHREARRMQELVHPHIVRVYDWDRDPQTNTDFIIMELLEGRTLARILKSSEHGKLAFPRALHIIEAVASALQHAHARDVIHTDIKPGNIFVTRTSDVKVLDFGTARRLNPFPGGEDDPTVIYLDRIGALTPAYASLEMLKGEDPTPMDDVYGLGVLAYMMLAGRHPYDKKSAEDALKEKLKPEKPKDLANWRWPALRRALQLRQDERAATIAEFIEGFTKKPWWRIIG